MNNAPAWSPDVSIVTAITVGRASTERWQYRFRFGGAGMLLTAAQTAETLLTDLATLLYEDNALTMETAERLQYLASAVIADSEVEDCTNCGGSGQTGPAADPDSCNRCRGTGKAPLEIVDAEDGE